MAEGVKNPKVLVVNAYHPNLIAGDLLFPDIDGFEGAGDRMRVPMTNPSSSALPGTPPRTPLPG
jgi:hypothetical protein